MIVFSFRIRSADAAYMKMFRDEVNSFCDRLRKRGKDKRDEAMAEYEAEEKAKRVAASPGGLDPQEVYESLPEVRNRSLVFLMNCLF